MGLNIDYFYSLTPRQFYNISKGYRKKEEDSFKLSWEQTRSIMFTVASPHFKKSKQNSKISDFMPFPWEKEKEENERNQLSRKEVNKIFNAWDKIEFKKK